MQRRKRERRGRRKRKERENRKRTEKRREKQKNQEAGRPPVLHPRKRKTNNGTARTKPDRRGREGTQQGSLRKQQDVR